MKTEVVVDVEETAPIVKVKMEVAILSDENKAVVTSVDGDPTSAGSGGLAIQSKMNLFYYDVRLCPKSIS